MTKKQLIKTSIWNFLFILAALVANVFTKGDSHELSEVIIRGYIMMSLLILLIIMTFKEQFLKN